MELTKLCLNQDNEFVDIYDTTKTITSNVRISILNKMNFVLSYIRRQFPDVTTVDTTTMSSWLESTNNSNISTVLADCRRQDEYDVSHIPGSEPIHFRCSDDELKAC